MVREVGVVPTPVCKHNSEFQYQYVGGTKTAFKKSKRQNVFDKLNDQSPAESDEQNEIFH